MHKLVAISLLTLLLISQTIFAAPSFVVIANLTPSSSPQIFLQPNASSTYNFSLSAQIRLASGAFINYPFSEIDWGDGTFTVGQAISTPSGEMHTYPKTSTFCTSTSQGCSYKIVMLITDSNAKSASGIGYALVAVLGSNTPSGISSTVPTIGTTMQTSIATTIPYQSSTGQSSGQPNTKAALCAIVLLIENSIYLLALVMFLIGGVMYSIGHLFVGSHKGAFQGYGFGIIVGAIVILIVAIAAPIIIGIVLGFGSALSSC